MGPTNSGKMLIELLVSMVVLMFMVEDQELMERLYHN